MKFTVLGASGYVGSRLVTHLRQQGYECFAPPRSDGSIFAEPLGHVIYCIGLTADFRERPYETARAHVGVLTEILDRAKYDSFLYLSSTRVYARSDTASNDSILKVDPRELSDLYNLTKLTGESLCFSTKSDQVRVVRLSNIYGSDWGSANFLSAVVRDAFKKKHVLMQTSPNSAKDYVFIDDVIGLIPKVVLYGSGRLYNLASGKNMSNQAILAVLAKVTEFKVEYLAGAPTIVFPSIDISATQKEFGFSPAQLENVLPKIVAEFNN